MRASEWAYVRSLSVGTGWGCEAQTADLTRMIVELLTLWAIAVLCTIPWVVMDVRLGTLAMSPSDSTSLVVIGSSTAERTSKTRTPARKAARRL